MTDVNNTVEIFKISTETYQLLDTTLKIGLGAIISGVTTYLITIRNHKHEILKLERNHDKEMLKAKLQMKIKILENITEIIDESIRKCDKYITFLLNNKKHNLPISELIKNNLFLDEYTNINLEFVTATNDCRKAVSKLKLLGFTNSVSELGTCIEILLNVYNKMHNPTPLDTIFFPNNEEYEKIYNDYTAKKNDYFVAINRDFENLK